MNSPGPHIALFFDADAYTELHARSGHANGPAGLMGRQVAGKEFLDAYLTHGNWERLSAIVRSRERADPLVKLCRDHPSSRSKTRRLSFQNESEVLEGASPFANVLYFPSPPDARFAWARRCGNRQFALSGVTHTLSSLAAIQALREFVIAPFEEFDALICTSRAVAAMVRAVTGAYADYLADRFSGSPRLRLRLEVIPLGVNTDRFRPPTADERDSARARIAARDDEIVLLNVGRLSHHAKAHPFPVFHAAEEAVRRTGRKIHLVFAGWAAHPAVEQAFRDGANQFAPSIRTSFVDGLNADIRSRVWHAADAFISLPDNIQETFGLVVVEAMASGLPVIGSDWDGYRDLVIDGETGYLVPSRMVVGATANSTTRLLFGQVTYDQFLAECSQSVSIDLDATSNALTRLVADDSLRRQMGAAGRMHADRRFAWRHIIDAYETLWSEQEKMVRGLVAKKQEEPLATYPPPEVAFASYPTTWLTDQNLVQSNPNAETDVFLRMPLTNLAGGVRCSDSQLLTDLLNSSIRPRVVSALVKDLMRTGLDDVSARSTIAWLLKYGLLRLA